MADSTKMPVLELTAQMRGRPAQVWVFRDRIEWSRSSGPGLLARSVLAAATEGTSEFVDGATGGDETGTVQIDAISSIATERVGMHVRLSFVTTGSTIEMDLSRSKASRMLETLRTLMSTEPPAGH